MPADPTFRQGYSYPDRTEPYREFTIIYHESFNVAQAFPFYYGGVGNNVGGRATGTPGLPTVGSVSDAFGINYGFGGLGSPILANRLEVGVLDGCTDCKYEEFFLQLLDPRRPRDAGLHPIGDASRAASQQRPGRRDLYRGRRARTTRSTPTIPRTSTTATCPTT